jgi:hypothetical protein
MALHSIEEKGGKLRPVLDPDYGIRYLQAERIFDLSPENTVEKLVNLNELGYLGGFSVI